MNWNWIFLLVQLGIFAAVLLYIRYKNKRARGEAERPAHKPSRNTMELQKLASMRARCLNLPLSEAVRPVSFQDVIGQEEGIRALKAALCGPNPQHVLIYGPPGIGKTCAARLVLEEAKKRSDSPFSIESQFVEIDATCVRFDERAIADPLLGSVHDPIYQGAGAMGTQGVPQPKPGAVSRAHCGILFLDEIGELHPMQMNKLLKVLEDRCVRFESAYYSPDNNAIPQHIHDIFQNGLPADFRLVGATTRRPEELPPALRSRCLELFFRPLGQPELIQVAKGASIRAGYQIEPSALERAALHSHSGRDAVNIIQLCCGLAYTENRKEVLLKDVEWVARTCNYLPRPEQRINATPAIGVANGLGVSAFGQGVLLEIECTAQPAAPGAGRLALNGIVEEEELNMQDRKLRRKGTGLGSVENVLCAFARYFGRNCADFDLRFNIPGGVPVDGPSAGVALAIALMSALSGKAPDPFIAATGEVTISGEVRPVGGVREKAEAACRAGATRVLIPADNWDESLRAIPIAVLPIHTLSEAMRAAFILPAAPSHEERALSPISAEASPVA